MHGLHARLPKNFVLEERLERYRDYIEPDPYSWAGSWAAACAPAGSEAFSEVRLDLGCGKGSFTVEAARREPEVLFIGMDSEPICIAYAAQHGFESELPNVVFVPGTGMRIREMFAPGELGAIYLNFPTPFPRKRDSAGRLVNLERLMDYQEVLVPGGEVRLRTDSQPLFDFALTQVPLAGYEIVWQSRDARAVFQHDEPAAARLGTDETAQGIPDRRTCRVFAQQAEQLPVPDRVRIMGKLPKLHHSSMYFRII